MMEIRKQILGIVIGIFITISFITPVYSYYGSNTNVCSLTASDLEDIVQDALDGNCYIGGRYIYC